MAPPLPRILSAVPQTLQVRLEIAKAVQTLALQREGQQRSIEGHLPECDAELIKECARELRREFLSFIKDRSRQRAAKAAVDDPKHPGWPAHTPGGKGGKFRPKDAVSVAAGESEAPPPGIGHNQGPPLAVIRPKCRKRRRRARRHAMPFSKLQRAGSPGRACDPR